MKNRRTITLSVVGAVLAAVALAAIVHWYRAGELPAGPASFFQPRELQRAQARLAAHRLDLQPAIELCHAIERHLQRASTIRFTNPQAAVDTLRSLANEIDQIALTHQDTLTQMEEGHPGTWEEPFADFLDTARTAYIDATRLCNTLSRQDWGATGFDTLKEQIVEAKGICADLQSTQLFPDAAELRTTLYPLFEQAYGDRNESDLARIHRRLLRPQPAITRWFYARLYQSQHAVPVDLCPDHLQAARDELIALAQEMTAADVQGILASWTFPRGRANHLEQFAGHSAPLEDAASIHDWLRMVNRDRDAWQRFLDTTAPDADAPDPELRDAAQWILNTADTTDRRLDQLSKRPNLTGTELLASAVKQSLRSHRELLDCPAAALGRALTSQASLSETYEQLLALPVDDSVSAIEAASRFQLQAAAFAESLGTPIGEKLNLDGMDHWLARQWPEVRRLDSFAAGLRALQDQGIIAVPRLAEIATLLEDVADSQTDSQRRDLVTRWDNGLSTAAALMPLMARQIEHGLESLELVTLREDIRDAIRLNEDDRMRTIAGRILATEGVGADLRGEARACITILDLPQHLHELDLENPDRNQPILPVPPDPESIVYPMYADRVAPILNVARNAKRLKDGDCAQILARIASDLETVWRLYPQWTQLDSLVDREAAGIVNSCIELEMESLNALADAVTRLAPRISSMRHQVTFLRALAELVETDPASAAFATRVQVMVNAIHLFEDPFAFDDSLSPVQEYLNTCTAVVHFHAQTRTITSYQRLRLEVAALRNAAMSPALAGYVSGLLRQYTTDLDQLYPLVRLDMDMIRATDAAPSPHLLELSKRYRRAEANATLLPALQGYAGAQASALEHYVKTNTYTINPLPEEDLAKQKPRILYSVLGPEFAGLGYGLRSKGKGTDLVVWLRTADQTVPLLTADWKDVPDDGYIELKDVELAPATFTWQWGHPVDIGMTVAHTQYEKRDLVPDDGDARSRWNPLDYAVYRVESNHYPIATFPNLEVLARDLYHLEIPNHGTARIQLDPLLNPEQTAETPAALIFMLGGLPVARDMDWPQFLPPPNAADARALGQDIRNAASNLFEEILGTP